MALTRHDGFVLSCSIQDNTAVVDVQGAAMKEAQPGKAEP
jgi:hypothetical protein